MYNRTSQHTSYLYENLKLKDEEIRVLKIQPDRDNHVIRCKLTKHDPDNDDFGYRCLSYVWGADEPTNEIIINGVRMLVRNNLWRFLHTARRYNLRVWIWIDAICINQDDNGEKAEQVQRMGEIYQNAKSVITWFDFSDKQVDSLLRLQGLMRADEQPPSRLDSKLVPVYKRLVEETIWAGGSFEEKALILLGQHPTHEVYEESDVDTQGFVPLDRADFALWQRYLDMGDAMTKLWNASYFERAWTVQELCLANKLQIIAPSKLIDMVMVLYCLKIWDCEQTATGRTARQRRGVRSSHLTLLLDQYSANTTFSDEPLNNPMSNLSGFTYLWEALEISVTLKCKDLRDRIYSILSLIKDGDDFSVKYDESLPMLAHRAFEFDQLVRQSHRHGLNKAETTRQMILKDAEAGKDTFQLIFSSLELERERPVPRSGLKLTEWPAVIGRYRKYTPFEWIVINPQSSRTTHGSSQLAFAMTHTFWSGKRSTITLLSVWPLRGGYRSQTSELDLSGASFWFADGERWIHDAGRDGSCSCFACVLLLENG